MCNDDTYQRWDAFFRLFARFEYALKQTGTGLYLAGDENEAKPNWDRFACELPTCSSQRKIATFRMPCLTCSTIRRRNKWYPTVLLVGLPWSGTASLKLRGFFSSFAAFGTTCSTVASFPRTPWRTRREIPAYSKLGLSSCASVRTWSRESANIWTDSLGHRTPRANPADRAAGFAAAQHQLR